MTKVRRNTGAKGICLGCALLMLFCVLLTAVSGKVHAYSTDAYPLDYDITVHLRISRQSDQTPDPGAQVFHFRIWSESGVALAVTNNVIYTNSYGVFEGHLTFSVATHEEAEALCNTRLFVQQYDGNENWKFDMHQKEYTFSFWHIQFESADGLDYSDLGDFHNVYSPAAPAPPQRQTFTVPCVVNVQKSSGTVPNPGPAVFHFRIWSDSGADLQIINNAVSTNGLGEFRGNLEFSVAQDKVQALTGAQLHIQQYDGNADWRFDTYAFNFQYGRDAEGPGFFRAARPGEIAPNNITRHVYVTNVYAPAQPEKPEPSQGTIPENAPENETAQDPDGGAEGQEETEESVTLYVSAVLNAAYKPRNGKAYYAGEPVVLWVYISNRSKAADLTEVTAYDDDSGEQITYDKRLYPWNMAGQAWNTKSLKHGGYYSTFMYYHVITPEEAKAGTYVFRCHAAGETAEKNQAVSDPFTFEVETTGYYHDYKTNPDDAGSELKTSLTVEIRESSQPAHIDADRKEFYTLGEPVRIKVVLKNETGEAFHNIVVFDPRTNRTYSVSELKPGESEKFFLTARVTGRDLWRGAMCRYVTVSCINSDNDLSVKRSDNCLISVGMELRR